MKSLDCLCILSYLFLWSICTNVYIDEMGRLVKRKYFFGCYVSVDGTNVQIFEPTPFSADWYGHKFKSVGTKNEVGVSIYKEI